MTRAVAYSKVHGTGPPTGPRGTGKTQKSGDVTMIDAALLAKLKSYDTPTICNALEVVEPARRLTGFTVRPLVCPFPSLPPIVGYAKTVTHRSTHVHELDASRGDVMSAVHQGLGCLGGVTGGSIRDIDQWAPGFQALAGSIVPSHAHVHLADFGKEVRVAGMLVRSGDIVHMDRHGAVTIPEAVAQKIPAACDLLGRKEAVILEMARAPG